MGSLLTLGVSLETEEEEEEEDSIVLDLDFFDSFICLNFLS